MYSYLCPAEQPFLAGVHPVECIATSAQTEQPFLAEVHSVECIATSAQTEQPFLAEVHSVECIATSAHTEQLFLAEVYKWGRATKEIINITDGQKKRRRNKANREDSETQVVI